MQSSGRSARDILALWAGVAAVCVIASGIGYLLADAVPSSIEGGLDGFAAGALIVMLVDAMIPEAREDAGPTAGLVTTLGFALGAALSFAA